MTTVNPERLCQLLIEVSDLGRAKAFYQEVFGWKAAPADLMEMVVFDVPRDCPFGIALIPKISPESAAQKPPTSELPGSPGGLKAVFAVDDPEAVLARCAAWEGCHVTGPRTQPGYGLVWDVAGPDGLTWGLFKRT